MTNLHHDDDHAPIYRVPQARRVVWVWRAALLCGLMLLASAVYTYGINFSLFHCGRDRDGLCSVYTAFFFILPSAGLAMVVALIAGIKYRALHMWVRLAIFLPATIIVVTLIYFLVFAGRRA